MSGNLLAQALSNLPKQTVMWYANPKTVTQANGLDLTTFDPPAPVLGSWQPIARKDYQALGLDMQKQFAMFYTTAPIVVDSRGVNGEQVTFGNQRYATYGADVYGWDGIMFQAIGPA
jgi:hypothetical protein